MDASLQKDLEKLTEALALLREELHTLNLEAEKWAKQRDTIHKQMKAIRSKANVLKEKRDTINAEVRELKTTREQVNQRSKEKKAQIRELRDRLRFLREKSPPLNLGNIQRRIDEIEWRIQTTSLPVKEEEALVNQVSKLEAQRFLHRQREQTKKELTLTQTEKNTLELNGKKIHEAMTKRVGESQKLHTEMIEKRKKISGLKVEADAAHRKYIETRETANDIHQSLVEIARKRTTLHKELQEARERKKNESQTELRKDLEEKAVGKLRRGEKLTWDEFRILAEKGLL